MVAKLPTTGDIYAYIDLCLYTLVLQVCISIGNCISSGRMLYLDEQIIRLLFLFPTVGALYILCHQ